MGTPLSLEVAGMPCAAVSTDVPNAHAEEFTSNGKILKLRTSFQRGL